MPEITRRSETYCINVDDKVELTVSKSTDGAILSLSLKKGSYSTIDLKEADCIVLLALLNRLQLRSEMPTPLDPQ